MSSIFKVAGFVVQSAAVGLAGAFLIVLAKPELVGSRSPQAGVASYAPAVAASAPAVANIYTETYTTSPITGEVLRRKGALGSGVVIDKRGYIVTNWHVVKDADQIYVQLADGRVATPRLVGTDPESELALLSIDLPDLPEVRLGRSDSLEVGEVVLAIGNSLGLSQTVTMGIVSATGRGLDVTTFEDFIQTDAAINAGNSGGALVNARGELVGINTAVISDAPRGQAMPEGLGFAIPVNLVRGVMEQLIAHGRVIRGYLGVDDSRDLSAADMRRIGVDGGAVLLVEVRGPAAAAGLRPGDVLTHINDQRMYGQQQALNLVARSQPGERIRIRGVHANGMPFSTAAVLEERPPSRNGG
jgi:serine peptidase DegS